VEGIVRIAAVRTWIAERVDDVEELRHGSRPTVRDDERERVGFG
jgi:hypothetical protein